MLHAHLLVRLKTCLTVQPLMLSSVVIISVYTEILTSLHACEFDLISGFMNGRETMSQQERRRDFFYPVRIIIFSANAI